MAGVAGRVRNCRRLVDVGRAAASPCESSTPSAVGEDARTSFNASASYGQLRALQAGERSSHNLVVAGSSIRTNDELWGTVAAVRDGLREAGATGEAQRLHDAMRISGHPGEVWPETRDVLRDLLGQRPRGLDEEAAAECVAYLDTWP